MPFRQNVGGGVSASKDTAAESDVRYPKTFHSGKGTKSKVGNILDCVIKKITPGTKSQTVQKGVYLADDIVVEGDENLVSENIKANANIFGVSGNANVVDTSGGNLTGGAMLKNYKGFSKGSSFSGEIDTLSDSSFSPADGSAYNDCKIVGSAANEYVGAFDYSVKGYIAGKIRVHIANLLGKNVKIGVRIGGIGGYIEGSFKGSGNAAAEHVLNGIRFSSDSLNNATGSMPDNGSVSKSLSPGGSYTIARGFHTGNGKVNAKSKNIKQLNVMAVRGFGSSSSNWEVGPFDDSFTMPAAGTVYYSGESACYNASGNVVCEVYRNGVLVDHRNINSSNNYTWRGTMNKKSFAVNAGDTITIRAAAISGSHAISCVNAVIEYFT